MLEEYSVNTIFDKIDQLEIDLLRERAQHTETLGLVQSFQSNIRAVQDSIVQLEAERKARSHAEELLEQSQQRCRALAQKLVETVRCRDQQVESEVRMAKEVFQTERESIYGTLQPLVPHGAVQEEGIAVAYLHSTVSAIRDQMRSIHEATTYLKRVCDNCSETGVVSVDSVRKILDRIATCAVCDTPSSISVMELSVANEIGAEESISRQRLFLEYSAVMQDMWSGFISRCLRSTRGSSSSVVSSTNYSSYQRPAMLMPPSPPKQIMPPTNYQITSGPGPQRTLVSPTPVIVEKENFGVPVGPRVHIVPTSCLPNQTTTMATTATANSQYIPHKTYDVPKAQQQPNPHNNNYVPTKGYVLVPAAAVAALSNVLMHEEISRERTVTGSERSPDIVAPTSVLTSLEDQHSKQTYPVQQQLPPQPPKQQQHPTAHSNHQNDLEYHPSRHDADTQPMSQAELRSQRKAMGAQTRIVQVDRAFRKEKTHILL